MRRWMELGQVPAGFGPSVVTLGIFDGVHKGHRRVLGATVARARAIGAAAVAVTLHPHPARVHQPDQDVALITGLEDRLELLEQAGLDAALVIDYTRAVADTLPEDFVRDYLVEALGVRVVVVGRDVRFGKGGAGDLSTMTELGHQYGFEVQVTEDVIAPMGPGLRWSSTWVRRLLADGDVAGAAQILGRPHQLRGTVVHGDGRGATLGYPTANIAQDVSAGIPADGVYVGWMVRLGRPVGSPDARLPVAISVGNNPTFGDGGRRIEAHVPGRTDLDLYGEQIVLEMVTRLRSTLRFESPGDLVAQLDDDVARVRDLLDDGPAPLGGSLPG